MGNTERQAGRSPAESHTGQNLTDVSVLTPSFNYGRFIEECIVSVLHQDGVSVQHLVQDGGSTDETTSVLRRHEDRIEWSSEPDKGQSDALNIALGKARGRWIAWLNADEFYLPGGLHQLVRRGDVTGADVVYGDNVFVDEGGHIARLLPQHPFSLTVLRVYGCFIPSSSMILRRSSLPSDPWDPSLRMMMDWDLYLRLASEGASFEKVDYPIGAFRRHGHQVTAQPAGEFSEEYAALFARYGIATSSRRWGRWLHGAYKLWSGAYFRQVRARRFRGLSLEWHNDHAARDTFDALLGTCYGRICTRSVPR